MKTIKLNIKKLEKKESTEIVEALLNNKSTAKLAIEAFKNRRIFRRDKTFFI